MRITLKLIALFVSLSVALPAQVVINEYSASNMNQYPDQFQRFEDWVELYNTSNQSVDLSGWYLSDKEDKPDKWSFPAGTTISGNGRLTVWCSGRTTYTGSNIHTSFKLTQTKANEVLTLSNSDLVLQEAIPLEITLLGHSRAREVDGGATWKVATDPTIANSNDGANYVKGYTSAPILSLQGGFYTGTFDVSIVGTEPNAEIRYTLDGTQPTINSDLYTVPLTVDQTMVIKAGAFSTDPGILPGKIDFQTYFIDESFTLPVISVAADEVRELANGNRDLRPIGTLEYFEDNEKVGAVYGELNSHGQDSWQNPHRSIDWVTRDEMGYSNVLTAKLFEYSERDEHQRIMMRASGDDNYPATNAYYHDGSCHVRDEYVHTLVQEGNMKCDIRAVRRMIVFLDGQYWGVYGIRERPVDHDYTKYYYDQEKFDLQYLSTWGSTEAEYGGAKAFEDWGILRDFILDNDMSDSANYEIVKDQLNVVSLMDYMIANLNTVASDWLNYNTGWWRGLNPDGDHKKWGYIIWDLDATFDYYINYSGVPNTDPDALQCDIDDIADFVDGFFGGQDVGKHEQIFLKLQEENEEFRQLYYSRQADLNNTIFSCESMLTILERMIGVIEPEMPRQIARWGGSMNEWENNVDELRDFVEERCINLPQGMTECFDLTGPFNVTLMTVPEDAGEIDFNTLDIEEFPWTGEYYGGMDNLIKAKAFDNDWEFSHWETKNGSIIFPDSLTRKAALQISGSDTLVAHFREIMISSISPEIDQLEFMVYPTLLEDQITIEYTLEENAQVDIALFDLTGRRVLTLGSGNEFNVVGTHKHRLNVNREELAQGVYFVKLNADGAQGTAKVILTE